MEHVHIQIGWSLYYIASKRIQKKINILFVNLV